MGYRDRDRVRNTMADTRFKKQMDEWFESEEGQKCQEGQPKGKYLYNRLFLAFSAGYTAAMERTKTLITNDG